MEQGRFDRLKVRVAVGLTALQCLQLAAVLDEKAHVVMDETIIDRDVKMVCED